MNKMTEPKIYYLDEKEVHSFGNYVAVVWNTDMVRKLVTDEHGKKIMADVQVRISKPYIAFITVLDYGNDGFREHSDYISGGHSWAQATKVAQELDQAIEYLRVQMIAEGIR